MRQCGPKVLGGGCPTAATGEAPSPCRRRPGGSCLPAFPGRPTLPASASPSLLLPSPPSTSACSLLASGAHTGAGLPTGKHRSAHAHTHKPMQAHFKLGILNGQLRMQRVLLQTASLNKHRECSATHLAETCSFTAAIAGAHTSSHVWFPKTCDQRMHVREGGGRKRMGRCRREALI